MGKATTPAEIADRLRDAAELTAEALDHVRAIKLWPIDPSTIMVYLARHELSQALGGLRAAADDYAGQAELEAARAARTARERAPA